MLLIPSSIRHLATEYVHTEEQFKLLPFYHGCCRISPRCLLHALGLVYRLDGFSFVQLAAFCSQIELGSHQITVKFEEFIRERDLDPFTFVNIDTE